MADAGMVQISDDLVASATKEMVAFLLQMFGFSKDRVQQFIQAGLQKQEAGGAPAQGATPAPGSIVAAARGAQA